MGPRPNLIRRPQPSSPADSPIDQLSLSRTAAFTPARASSKLPKRRSLRTVAFSRTKHVDMSCLHSAEKGRLRPEWRQTAAQDKTARRDREASSTIKNTTRLGSLTMGRSARLSGTLRPGPMTMGRTARPVGDFRNAAAAAGWGWLRPHGGWSRSRHDGLRFAVQGNRRPGDNYDRADHIAMS